MIRMEVTARPPPRDFVRLRMMEKDTMLCQDLFVVSIDDEG